MNCKQIHKLLPDYVDLNLSKEKSEKVHLHLEDCRECSALYQRLKDTLVLLKPTSDVSEQPFYYTRLKQRMENKIKSRESIFNIVIFKKVLQPAIYFASLIIAVYIGILIGSNSSIPNQFSKLDEEINYIKEFSEYNYLNDVEIEPIENLFLVDSSSINE